MFTELERKILDATDPKYKYICRIYGNLYLKTEEGDGFMDSFYCYNHIFKDVKDGDDPICFRKPILDDIEREYLKAVFKPFAKRIYWATKIHGNKQCYIWVCMNDDDFMELPKFDGKKMYKGMEIGKHYSLEDLDIRYDD